MSVCLQWLVLVGVCTHLGELPCLPLTDDPSYVCHAFHDHDCSRQVALPVLASCLLASCLLAFVINEELCSIWTWHPSFLRVSSLQSLSESEGAAGRA